MTATADVATNRGPITSPGDDRVGRDEQSGQYYLKDSGQDGGKRVVLVFVGVSLGPVTHKGVLQARIDPAAVMVEEGETLRWIIQDLNNQNDTARIRIIQHTDFWPFHGASPKDNKDLYTADRDAKDGKNYVETAGGRKREQPPKGKNERVRTKYSIDIEFQEDRDSPESVTLKARIDPDVVYNPPGY